MFRPGVFITVCSDHKCWSLWRECHVLNQVLLTCSQTDVPPVKFSVAFFFVWTYLFPFLLLSCLHFCSVLAQIIFTLCPLSRVLAKNFLKSRAALCHCFHYFLSVLFLFFSSYISLLKFSSFFLSFSLSLPLALNSSELLVLLYLVGLFLKCLRAGEVWFTPSRGDLIM